MNNAYENKKYLTNDDLDLIVGQKMTGVFGWMVLGILVTVITALYVLSNQTLLIAASKYMIGFIAAEFILVFTLSLRVYTMNISTSRTLFLLYSALNGITLSLIAIIYTGTSIILAFMGALCIFLIMALYGYITKEDLSRFGNLFKVGLITLVILSLVNLFFRTPMLYWIVSYLGVFIFTGLIGYDVNRIKKNIVYAVSENEAVIERVSIIGALALYLDFINLFLYILRIFGKRR